MGVVGGAETQLGSRSWAGRARGGGNNTVRDEMSFEWASSPLSRSILGFGTLSCGCIANLVDYAVLQQKVNIRESVATLLPGRVAMVGQRIAEMTIYGRRLKHVR